MTAATIRLSRISLALVFLVGLAVLWPAVGSAKTSRCVVPKVAGLSLAKAERRLKAADCRVGKITRPKVAKLPVVGSTTPTAGRRVKAGTKVRIGLIAETGLALKGKVSYKASVDPSFTQDPTDPLVVTYDYSADAIATNDSLSINLAQDDALPDGVLNLYSSTTPNGPEALYCSMEVGGATSDGACPITYSDTGTYNVTTEYIPSGTAAVTETDQETISPFSTSTNLTATSIACGALVPSSLPNDPSGGVLQEGCYTLALSSTAPVAPAFVATPTVNDAQQNAGIMAPGDTCTLVVFWYQGESFAQDVAGGYSPDCSSLGWRGFGYATSDPAYGTYDSPVTTWTLTTSFPDSPGWIGSSSSVHVSS